MSQLPATTETRIPAMSEDAIAKVRQLEEVAGICPQLIAITQHVIHGGMYARTVMIPAGAMLTGALVEVATMLIVQGHAEIFIGEDTIAVRGYNCFPASAGRKQAIIAHENTYITMVFPTPAQTIADAEDWFTDEAHLLCSRRPEAYNSITITGE